MMSNISEKINGIDVKTIAYISSLTCGMAFADKIAGAAFTLYKENTGKNPGIASLIGGSLFDMYIGHLLATITYKYVESIEEKIKEKEIGDVGVKSEA